MKTQTDSVPSFVTKDGSIIRELMHPQHHTCAKQSLAQATVPAGSTTLLHRHLKSEEFYHFTQGNGTMILGDKTFPVQAGDTVAIAPGTVHAIKNDTEADLVLLCCCTPPYSHEDTELM